ncbi:MAG: hypothetical protein QOE05_1267 [Actinomycetota bacterium]|nr:hypothetical protein [Actinomycetota bacterium]
MHRTSRFFAYGLAGWCSEILTTGVRSHGRDGTWRLTGHTYLWMLPIYGSAAVLFEPAHDRLRERPWWQRGVAWVAGIYAVEAASGTAVKALTGEVPWDYSRSRGSKPVPQHWRGLVRPSYAPLWFAVGMGLEQLHDRLVRA